YRITVFQDKHPIGSWWKMDDVEGEGEAVQLTDDGLQHHVEMHYSVDGWPTRKNRIGAVDALGELCLSMSIKLVNYYRIERALSFLTNHFKEQPDLAEIAAKVHMSPFHFQRIFTDWVGI